MVNLASMHVWIPTGLLMMRMVYCLNTRAQFIDDKDKETSDEFVANPLYNARWILFKTGIYWRDE